MRDTVEIYRSLAVAFAKIGLFGFGGGYAMLPMLRHEVVDSHAWLDAGGFADLVAISQMTPGPIMVNAATYCGYVAAAGPAGDVHGDGVFGAAVATLAVMAAPFLLMWFVCRHYDGVRDHPRVRGALKALRPVVVGMVAAAALSLMPLDETTSWSALAGWALVFGAAFWATARRRWHPIPVLLASGAAGLVFF